MDPRILSLNSCLRLPRCHNLRHGRPPQFRLAVFLHIASGFVGASAIPDEICELMRYPETYNERTVKIRATWVYGFEWSYLHCLDCEGRAWLDTSELDEQSRRLFKHIPKYAAIMNVDVEGVFQAGGSFGHLNGYKYQVRAHTISNPAVISTGMKGRAKELAIEREFACGGVKPR